LFGFCGFHGMSVYSIQLNEVVCFVNVRRTLNIVTCPVSSLSLEITVACDKWKGPKNNSCCWDMLHYYSVCCVEMWRHSYWLIAKIFHRL
jgi:hypothetical protein